MIWLNNNITFKKKLLWYKNWVNSDILFIGDIVKGNSFLKIDDLKCKLRYRDGRWLSEYTKILAAIPARWRYVIKNDKQASDKNFNLFRRKCLVYSNIRLIEKDISIHSVTVKEIYRELVKLEQLPSRAIEFWDNTLPQTGFSVNWSDTWFFKLKQVKDNSLIQFNFKFMYNIVPTPVNLFKWKLKDNNLCQYCHETGHIIHVFFYCKEIRLFWKFIEEIIQNTILRNYEFKPFHVVYNYCDKIQGSNSIDLLMNYALFSIYKARVIQNKITKNIVIKHLSHLLRSRLDIEKNRTCKRDINVSEWTEICRKVEEMFIV